MSFPSITFKHTNIEVSRRLQDLITDKLRPLEKYLQYGSDVRCNVEFEKIVSHQNGNIHRVEANIWRSGRLFQSEATMESFEKAVDEVKQELEKELERAHDRRLSRLRRGARKIKEMILWGR